MIKYKARSVRVLSISQSQDVVQIKLTNSASYYFATIQDELHAASTRGRGHRIHVERVRQLQSFVTILVSSSRCFIETEYPILILRYPSSSVPATDTVGPGTATSLGVESSIYQKTSNSSRIGVLVPLSEPRKKLTQEEKVEKGRRKARKRNEGNPQLKLDFARFKALTLSLQNLDNEAERAQDENQSKQSDEEECAIGQELEQLKAKYPKFEDKLRDDLRTEELYARAKKLGYRIEVRDGAK